MRNTEEDGGVAGVIDARMTDIVERMFERCYADGGIALPSFFLFVLKKINASKSNDSAWTHALGVAIESRRLDRVRDCLERAPVSDVRSFRFPSSTLTQPHISFTTGH